MAEYDIKVESGLLPGLLNNQEGIARLVETILNQILQAQVTESLGASRFERSEERSGYRNGVRPRHLYTRIGQLTLQVPQTREGAFSTEIFRRYQRSEQALVLAMMEMVVNGVSSRKVSAITEELCGTSFSKSTVSSLCTELDARVRVFNERRLEGNFPFVMVDALFFKAHDTDRVAMRAALIISGINERGDREVLGLRIGNTENQTSWEETFGWLKERGLQGVYFVISDEHQGLTQAISRYFQGATWQRCQVHLMRNILGHCSIRNRTDVAAAAKLVFQAADIAEAKRRLEEFSLRFAKTAPKAVSCLENGFLDAMAVMSLPEKYRKRLRTTNMQERLNQEIRRREKVIRIFPNDDSAKRIMGAVLADINERWQEQKYFDMDEFREWLEKQKASDGNNVIAIRSFET